MTMRLYLDVCCLNRPFDDQSQERIRIESEAVEFILESFERGVHHWVSSTAVEEEVSRNPDIDQRVRVEALLKLADERLLLGDSVLEKARSYRGQGIRRFDALHVALAECHGCELLLTVDDDLIRKTRSLTPPLRVRVENPARWLLESGAT
ncbi:MAG: PIN domain-containing protein [Planctomycetes bacterium]|nr:PIN domain-containing protein [Planctomycetota bacterium]